MKTANIDREFLHIFWTIWGKSMNFSGKMCFKIILKVSKNQGFTLSLEDTIFEKPQGLVNLTLLSLREHLRAISIDIFFTIKYDSFPMYM